MDIKKLIEEIHADAIAKGWYECPECENKSGLPRNKKNINRGYSVKETCGTCHGTGIDPNRNIGEMLMLIVSELGEALEAHRCGKFADWAAYHNLCSTTNKVTGDKADTVFNSSAFSIYIKDSFEDEIADVYIRLLDLCGYLGIEPDKEVLTSVPKIQENVAQCLLRLSYEISSMDNNGQYMNGYLNENNYGYIFAYLREFCFKHDIPIEKHIEAKMAYNKTRPYKHGKDY